MPSCGWRDPYHEICLLYYRRIDTRPLLGGRIYLGTDNKIGKTIPGNCGIVDKYYMDGIAIFEVFIGLIRRFTNYMGWPFFTPLLPHHSLNGNSLGHVIIQVLISVLIFLGETVVPRKFLHRGRDRCLGPPHSYGSDSHCVGYMQAAYPM